MLLTKLIIVGLICLVCSSIIKKKFSELEKLLYEQWQERQNKVSEEALEACRRAENTHRFYWKLETFSRIEGIEYKVWEDFKEDGLTVRLYDPKTNLSWQTLVKRKEYEEDPITCMYNIRTSWRAALEKSYKEE